MSRKRGADTGIKSNGIHRFIKWRYVYLTKPENLTVRFLSVFTQFWSNLSSEQLRIYGVVRMWKEFSLNKAWVRLICSTWNEPDELSCPVELIDYYFNIPLPCSMWFIRQHSPLRSVTVYRLIAKNTVEEGILQCAQTKLRLEQDMALAGELKFYTSITWLWRSLKRSFALFCFLLLFLTIIVQSLGFPVGLAS